MVERLIICGIDEVGRGPLAGPVVAASVILPKRKPRFFKDVTDSKKLTREKREALYPMILQYCQVGIGQASVEEIDSINIFHATFLAMQRAVAALPVAPHKAMVDGKFAPKLDCEIQMVIGGDALIPSIAAASIVAKVTRDAIMRELHEQFPHYGWASNVGYSAPSHYRALDEHGPTLHHRRSFAPVRMALEKWEAPEKIAA